MCRCLRIQPSGYYAWQKSPLSQRAREDARQTELIRQAWNDSGKVYGYRKLHDDLLDQGEACCPNRVARLTRLAGIKAQIGYKRRPGSYGGKPSLAVDNTLDRQFDVAAPDRAWVTDITYIRTLEGFAYLAVVIDLYSRRVVGWSMQSRQTTDVVLQALHMVVLSTGTEDSAIAESSVPVDTASGCVRDDLGIRRQDADERLAVRRELSVPLMAELHAWLTSQLARLSRNHDLAKAINYMLRRWDAFARVLTDGRVCLTNNAAERALRTARPQGLVVLRIRSRRPACGGPLHPDPDCSPQQRRSAGLARGCAHPHRRASGSQTRRTPALEMAAGTALHHHLITAAPRLSTDGYPLPATRYPLPAVPGKPRSPRLPSDAPADRPQRSTPHIGPKDRRNPIALPSSPPLSRKGSESLHAVWRHEFFEVSILMCYRLF